MLKLEVKVDGRAWIPKSVFSKRKLKELRSNLQIRLKPSFNGDGPVVVDMLEETDFHVGLPRGYFDRTSAGRLNIIYDVSTEGRNLVPAIFARDGVQSEGVRALTMKLQEQEAAGAILCAATGLGKTVMGLLIAGQLGYATLVVVHTKVLMDQWLERIKVKPGVLPDASVGIFQGDREEFGDKYDIVIAMVHTLANRSADHPIFSWPGLVIVDETHRMGAPTWNAVAHRFKAAKRLGLTATPYRRDGGDRLFLDTVGQIAWTAKTPMMIPKVKKKQTVFEFPDKGLPPFLEDKYISEDMLRNQQIVREVAMARKVGRNILILTKLVSHALILKNLISSQVSASSIGVCVGGWYCDEDDASDYLRIGRKKYQDKFKLSAVHVEKGSDGPKKVTAKLKYDYRKIRPDIHKVTWAERKIRSSGLEIELAELEAEITKALDPDKISDLRRMAGVLRKCITHSIKSVEPKRKPITTEDFAEATEKDIIIATYQMVSEGFDVPRLDTLFLAMPVWDPVQSTGRILRSHPDKKVPIVTHFIDDKIPKYRRAWQACRRHYQDLGVDV